MHEQQDQKTILLVEDEALIAVMEKQTLIKHCFNVIIASSGEKAIEVVNTTPNIDLILMDINLGKGMDGTEAAEIILRDKDIPVLFLSSYTQPEVVQKTEKITSYGYVVKDSGETVLITSIQMAFKLYEAHQKIKQGAEQFRAISNTAIDGFWVTDIEGRILDVNEAYCSMTGYSRNELLKMSIPDLDAIEDEYMATQHMEKLIEKGSDRFESKHRRKDGQIIDVEVNSILAQEQRCLVFIQDITKRKRAEEALLASEALFRTLAESAPVGVYITDQDGNCTYINRRWGQTAAMTLEEACGEGWMNGLHPEDRTMIGDNWYRSVQSGGAWGFEYRFQDGAGYVTWVYGTAAALYATDGTITGYVGTNVDITARKHAEEKERASERKYRIVADNTHDWEYWLDHQERFIYCSPSCERVTGYKAEEFLADPDLFDRIVHPDHRTDFVAHKKGACQDRLTDEIEFRIIRYDGAERWIDHSCQAVYDENGLFTGIRGSNRDITDRKQRDEAMRESKLQLEMAISASNTGLWDWDLKTNKVFFSPEWKRHIGYEEWEISNDFSEWQNRVHPDDLERAQSTIQNFLENPYPDFENEFRFRHKNGSYRWILAKASVLTDEKGNPLKMFGSHLDITDRKQMEENLQCENDLLQAVMNGAKNAHLVYLDCDFNFVRVNETYATTCGYKQEEMIGKNLFALYPNDENEAIFARVRDTGEVFKIYDKPFEFPDQPERGVTYWDWTLTPVKGSGGQVTGLVYSLFETSERKQTEEALRESEQRFYNAFEYASIGKALVSPEGKWLKVNRAVCDMLGYSEQELLAKTFQDITYSDDLDTDLTYVEQMLSGSIPTYQMEKRYFHKNGHIVWVLLSVSLVWDRYGIPDYFISQIVDITDRKIAEDNINSLLAEKELLLREVHHRIKNNMNVIMSLLSLQSSTMEDNPSAVAALEDSRSRVQSMMVLYDKLYRSADFRAISTREYLTSLIDEIVGNFPKRLLITVEKKIDDANLDAKILSPVGMILNELLTNTIKHAFIGRETGAVVLSLWIKETHATFIIQDNGIGIPESIDIGTSTGFGMQLVSMLTAQLEGAIRLERENGTKFVLEFEL